MLQQKRWMLPEGIEDVMPHQAGQLEQMRRQLLDLFDAWGYDLVIPPMIEYLESLQVGTGDDLELRTFKLIDQLTGRMMGVRADMTPQVARIDAHRLQTDAPARLCYIGTVLHTLADGFGGSRSPLQVGAEIYGHAGVESDAEVMTLMLESIEQVGIKAVHVDLGHVGIFRGLARQAGLTSQDEARFFEALQRKARPDIESLLAELGLAADLRAMFLALVDLNGGGEVLSDAQTVLSKASDEVLGALENLKAVAQEVKQLRPDVSPHFDLAELRAYNYQTGVVFAAFVPGHGQEIARGGRYDHIGKVFGRARPATGFSTDLKTLLALRSTDAPTAGAGAILAPWPTDEGLRQAIAQLRNTGERVVCRLPGQDDETISRQLVERQGSWVVVGSDE